MSRPAEFAVSAGPVPPARPIPWLFSRTVDLLTFLGSAVVSLLLLAVGAAFGVLHSASPEWTWIGAVLLLDVAHVYATAFRTYFDRAEFRRRRALFLLTPAAALAIGWAVYSEYGPTFFWRALAYLAVFHFVRQQYGWVALYRSRAGEHDRFGQWVDSAAVYLASVYPLVWWHAHLPRRFGWMLDSGEDFIRHLPGILEPALRPIWLAALVLYFGRSAVRGVRNGLWNPGKDLVVLTTAVCWYVGMIVFNSDYAFTVTNVVIHGVPYFVLVYWSWSRSTFSVEFPGPEPTRSVRWRRVLLFLGPLWVFAFVEEFLWDRGVWHEREWLFGVGQDFGEWRSVFVPLLAVPQVTHYLLDGFIWKRRSNPELCRFLT